MNKQNSKIFVVSLCIVAVLCLLFCSDNSKKPNSEQNSSTISTLVDNLSTTEQAQPTTNASNDLPFELSDIPRYSGSPFCEVNNNKPELFMHILNCICKWLCMIRQLQSCQPV